VIVLAGNVWPAVRDSFYAMSASLITLLIFASALDLQNSAGDVHVSGRHLVWCVGRCCHRPRYGV
jgi:hypothetical protein